MAYQKHRRRRAAMEIRRGMHGIKLEVVRTFKKEEEQKKVARSTGRIEYVAVERVHTVRGGHRPHQECDKGREGRILVGLENRQKFVGLGGWHADKMCPRSAAERFRHIRGPEESDLEEHGLLCGRSLRRTVKRARCVSCVCPRCELFSMEDFYLVSKRHQSRQRRRCDWWCAACGEQYDWRESNWGTDNTSKL